MNAPDAKYNPSTDDALVANYDSTSHVQGKKDNKAAIQEQMGLDIDPDAPIFFWPSRFDPVQKGCQLLSDILFRTVSDYWDEKLQIVMVANGSYQDIFRHIAGFHNIRNRVGICNFDEATSRLGYAASDFVLMPSLFEPCGLPQMVGSLYGSLPLAHDTGGLHDTVTDITEDGTSGNGFIFRDYDANALRWSIDQAMAFHKKPEAFREATISRIMLESLSRFNHSVCAQEYVEIYENMLERPLINPY